MRESTSDEIRTAIGATVLAALSRAAVRQTAPRMPIFNILNIKPLAMLIDESLLRKRMIGKLSLLFGVLPVVLAAMGLYGVLGYSVGAPTRSGSGWR